MTYTYERCLEEIHAQIKRYKTARRMMSEDINEYQDIRDMLTEALFFFGITYADIRYNAEAAEMKRKLFYIERKVYWKEQHPERGLADLIESKTLADSKTVEEEELQAKKQYYKARILMERADQELNSISSKIKILLKNGKG